MSLPPGRSKPLQTQRFSYRPLLGQAGHPSHRFGQAALVDSGPSLLHTDPESVAVMTAPLNRLAFLTILCCRWSTVPRFHIGGDTASSMNAVEKHMPMLWNF